MCLGQSLPVIKTSELGRRARKDKPTVVHYLFFEYSRGRYMSVAARGAPRTLPRLSAACHGKSRIFLWIATDISTVIPTAMSTAMPTAMSTSISAAIFAAMSAAISAVVRGNVGANVGRLPQQCLCQCPWQCPRHRPWTCSRQRLDKARFRTHHVRGVHTSTVYHLRETKVKAPQNGFVAYGLKSRYDMR